MILGAKKNMVVTTSDFRRLIGLAHFFDRKDDTSVIAERLLNGLSSAKTLSQEDISNKIVTMNSRVLLTEIAMNRQTEITVTYPQDADSTERRVSIFVSCWRGTHWVRAGRRGVLEGAGRNGTI